MTTASPSANPLAPDRALDRALRAASAAIDKKADNVRILDLRGISGITDYFVIASAMSDRQVQAICDGVMENLARSGARALSTEGRAALRWVVIDYDNVVVHVFLDAIRDYYDLEGLWSRAPRVPVPSEFYGPGGTREA